MTEWQEPGSRRAAEYRRAFDLAFSEPPAAEEAVTESLLALRTGGNVYAVRLAEIAGLFADRTIVRLPSPVPEFLGVAGLRHEVVPVYGLRTLLGHETRAEPPRWLMLARASYPVAFAFEQFEGYLRVPSSAVRASKGELGSAQMPDIVRLADGMRGVVSVASLLVTIEQRIRHLAPTKEQ